MKKGEIKNINNSLEVLAEKLAGIFVKQIELKKPRNEGSKKNNEERNNENTDIRRKTK